MSSYTSSIRSIERTNAYVPVQAVRPYAYYPYRDGEPQQAPDHDNDWNRIYQHAANSAAAWVQTAKQAQSDIDQLTRGFSNRLNTGNSIADHLFDLTHLINHLESQYKQHADLNPGLWSSIEQALRHPAFQELGLHRNLPDGRWSIDSTFMKLPSDKPPAISNNDMPLFPNESLRIKKLLLGADGMLNKLKHSLTYAEQQRAIDLLRPKLAAALPYNIYYSSIQCYRPLPYVGLILNRYL